METFPGFHYDFTNTLWKMVTDKLTDEISPTCLDHQKPRGCLVLPQNHLPLLEPLPARQSHYVRDLRVGQVVHDRARLMEKCWWVV